MTILWDDTKMVYFISKKLQVLAEIWDKKETMYITNKIYNLNNMFILIFTTIEQPPKTKPKKNSQKGLSIVNLLIYIKALSHECRKSLPTRNECHFLASGDVRCLYVLFFSFVNAEKM